MMTEPNVEQRRDFNRFLNSAKKCESSGSILDALMYYKKCAAIRIGDPKIEKKIQKLENEVKMTPKAKREGKKSSSKAATPARHLKDRTVYTSKKDVYGETDAIDLSGLPEGEATPTKPKKTSRRTPRKKRIVDDDDSDDDVLSPLMDESPSSKPKGGSRTPSRRRILDDSIDLSTPQKESLNIGEAPLDEEDEDDIFADLFSPSPSQKEDLSNKENVDENCSGLDSSRTKKDSGTPPRGKSGEADLTPSKTPDEPADSISPEKGSLLIPPKEASVPEPNDVDMAHGDNLAGNNADDIIPDENPFGTYGNESPTVWYDVNEVNPDELVENHSSDSKPSDGNEGISGDSNDSKDDVIEDDDDSSTLKPVFSSDLIILDSESTEESPKEQVPKYVEIGKLRIPTDLYEKLYGYQKEGVKWLWKLHNTRPRGGILCDDMGLGKTIQVSTFLIGLIRGKVIKKALIVVPVSVIHQWKDELSKWAPGVSVTIYHGNCSTRRPGLSPGVWITTYGMVLNRDELLSERVVWDYVVLDEGHTIKNYNAQISQRVRLLHSKRRLVMTGTPITNNLQELWSLLDWACQGELLGDKRTFHTEFEERIISGSDKSASDFDKELGRKIAESLRDLIEPHVLRREKKDYLEKSFASSQRGAEMVAKSPEKISVRKNDLVVWLTLTPVQENIYREFLESDEVSEIFNSSKSPLAAIGVLQKICCHPALLKEATKTSEALDLSFLHEKGHIVKNSTKIIFLINLLHKLIEDGHRTLIFSRSTKILDIIKKCLDKAKIKSTRIDGTFNPDDRMSVISEFESDKSISCFLLTTQVGAVGLNLVAADRVVIFDPSWSTLDDQAVDRVYRIGQKRNVIIYRLITCGTVEEKMYRRQVFKQSLMRTAMENDSAYRYFTRAELRELFEFDDSSSSITQKQISELHKEQRKSYPELDENIKFIEGQENVSGVSDHDLLFSVKNSNVDVKEVDELEKFVTKAVSTLTNKPDQEKGKTAENGIVIEDDDDDNEGSSWYKTISSSPLSRDRKRKRKRVEKEDADEEDSRDEEDDDPISEDSDDAFLRRRWKDSNRRLSDSNVIDLVDDDDDHVSLRVGGGANLFMEPPAKRPKRANVVTDDISDSDSDERQKRKAMPSAGVHGKYVKTVGPLKIKRPKSSLNYRNKKRYNELQHKLKGLLLSGDEIKTFSTAIEMLSICDEDPVLQAIVWDFGKKLYGSA